MKTSEAPEMENAKQLWERLYSTRHHVDHPWAQARPHPSLDWILEFLPYRKVRIIDVGGGPSALLDCLIAEGYQRPTLLEIAPGAIALAKERLGERHVLAQWVEGDVCQYRAPAPFALWHDRGLFSCLPAGTSRRDYVDTLWRTLFPGGLAMIAAYAPTAPDELENFPLFRLDAAGLAAELGAGFRLRISKEISHPSSRGEIIPFTYALFEKT